MDAKRLWHIIRLWTSRGSYARGRYLREHHVFKSIGENFSYQPRMVPLYANLIKVGNNVTIASDVRFDTHDGIHTMLTADSAAIPKGHQITEFHEGMGCIELGNHVFIGAGSHICYNVRIGDNVVVTACSVVTNDIPSNSVVRGNPARVVCSLSQFLSMKVAKKGYPNELPHRMGKFVGGELENWLWEDFEKSRGKQ